MNANEQLMEANLTAVYAALAAKPPKSQVERCDVEYDDGAHHEEWRNQCARDLNVILNRVAQTIENGTSQDNQFAEAALRIVERVAEFEQITEVEELDERELEPEPRGCVQCFGSGRNIFGPCQHCTEDDCDDHREDR